MGWTTTPDNPSTTPMTNVRPALARVAGKEPLASLRSCRFCWSKRKVSGYKVDYQNEVWQVLDLVVHYPRAK